MKKLNPLLTHLILDGLRTTGNYGDTLCYIEENLTFDQLTTITAFFEYLEDNSLSIGSGNIHQRFQQYRKSQSLAIMDNQPKSVSPKKRSTTMSDPKALARSLRRRYRRNRSEMEKLFKGKTKVQILTKANIEKFGQDVLSRYLMLQLKAADAKNKKAPAKTSKFFTPAPKPSSKKKVTHTAKVKAARASRPAEVPVEAEEDF